MNRFDKPKIPAIKYISRVIPIAFFIGLFVLFWGGLNSVSETTSDKQYESLQTAIERSVSQCYAIEGKYPTSVSYLQEHYGLTYNKDIFYVDYTYIGSNIYPEFAVLRKTGSDIRN